MKTLAKRVGLLAALALIALSAAHARLGGLAGTVNAANGSAVIYASCGLGDMSATGRSAKAGGLIGETRGADVRISAAYARGDISGGAGATVGGLIGRNAAAGADTLEVSESYSAGSATTTSGGQKGGFIGDPGAAGSATFADSYWNATSSGIPDDADANAPEGKTNSQMRNPTTAAGIYANWDAAIWDFGNPAQYPALIAVGLSAAAQRR